MVPFKFLHLGECAKLAIELLHDGLQLCHLLLALNTHLGRSEVDASVKKAHDSYRDLLLLQSQVVRSLCPELLQDTSNM